MCATGEYENCVRKVVRDIEHGSDRRSGLRGISASDVGE